MLFSRAMAQASHFRNLITVTSAVIVSACAGSADRYPDLNLRDFERVQGTFLPAATASGPTAPASMMPNDLADLESALASADEHHAVFISEAERVRPIVEAAAGTGLEDNRWPIAQAEIAVLESRSGEIMSLLANLDSMYADASLSFTEREQIIAARAQLGSLHEKEQLVIANLLAVLGGN